MVDWWLAILDEDEEIAYEEFKYIFCSFLLVKQPGLSYFNASPEHMNLEESDILWYDEYSLPIGQPTGIRYMDNQCCIRDYESAKIIVNPTESNKMIRLDNTEHKWLDWFEREEVTSVILPKHSSKILLSVSK